MPSEIRKDYIQDRFVIISPQRKKRPHDIERPEFLNPPSKKGCVFCPAQIDKLHALSTVGSRKRWFVKAVPNKFPAVQINNPKAYGRQEIIIETPDHLLNLEDLPEEHIVKIFEAYAARTREISKDSQIEYIIIFKNNGGGSGATIQHSHSQIFASAFVPPDILDRSQHVNAYRLHHGTCPYCDIIEKEKDGPRFIWQDENIIAFTPYASFVNYQARIMPKKHVDNVTGLSKEVRLSIAKIFKHVLRKISHLQLPYNFYFHQIIHDENEHFYIEISPRGSVWAGLELGSGLTVNSVTPESAALYYKQGLSK